MGLIDKLLDFEKDTATKLIIKASEKQRRMNAILEAGAEVRISSIEVQMGKEPSFAFCVEPHAPQDDQEPAQ